MSKRFFSGVSTALITPFSRGKVDYKSLKKLIQIQLDAGIQGFVVCGSTGEAATLSLQEKSDILKFVSSQVANQVPLLMGIGTNNTAETVHLAKIFSKEKCDGFLVVVPYYNKPPQRGLLAHFSAVARATTKKIILYNVPSRTITKLEVEPTLKNLIKIKNIVGIKEAAGNIEVIKHIKKITPNKFSILSGDDETFIDAMNVGACGVISVVSHVIPKICLRANSDDKVLVQEVSKQIFIESNPIPVKWVLKEMGIIKSAELRLPLVSLESQYHKTLKSIMKKAGAL